MREISAKQVVLSNRQLFLRHVAQTSDSPLQLEIGKAEGVRLYDADGKAYIDLIAGISVSNVGHCHPRVVEAVQQQAATYMHTLVYGEFILSPQAQLARRLSELLPSKLDNVYFVNSGSEAVEGALKTAKRYTGRPDIVAFEHSYHGSSHGALSILGDEYFKQKFRPLVPGHRMIRYNDLTDLQRIDERTAAVVIEPVQAEAGVIPPQPGFLQAVRDRCNETGTLLIFDEIQTGCGRTGTLFALEHSGVVPDIILLAKGLGGGMPIGAFIASKEIMQVLTDQPFLGHITTFGGHPVCCAAARAALEVIIEERLADEVAGKSALFTELLAGHPAVRAFRSVGLMMALELDSYEAVKRISDHCLAHGVIIDWFLFAPNCVRIAPPLIISESEIREACAVLGDALDKLPS